MKKLCVLLTLCLAVVLSSTGCSAFLLGIAMSEDETDAEAVSSIAATDDANDDVNDDVNDDADASSAGKGTLGDFDVEIVSCRCAEDYEGKPIVIIKYAFTNNSDKSAAFVWSLETNIFQDGVGLNDCYFADDSANYSSDNQTKEIKPGVTLEVEEAYVLNDSTTDVVVEVNEYLSWRDDVITKTFSFS